VSHRVRIHGQAFGGDSVGRLADADGKVIFLPFGAIGDLVDVRILREKSRFASGEILRLVEEGEGRRHPKCKLYGDCGGCQWQHLDAPSQRLAKENILKEFFPPSASIMTDCEMRPLLAVDQEWRQRRRIRMQWRGTKLGFFRRGSRDFMDVEACPVIVPCLEEALAKIRAVLLKASGTRQGKGKDKKPRCSGNMVLLANARGEVHLSIRIDEGVFLGEANDFLIAPIVGGSLSDKGGGRVDFGAASLNVAADDTLSWHSSAAAFAQADMAQERVLQECVAEELQGHDRVLELFAGVGTLTKVLGRVGRHLVAVESAPGSVHFLEANCEQLAGDVECVKADARRWLKNATPGDFDAVLLDPPREGCRQLMPDLVRLQPEKIVYVSCDPSTLKRDLTIACEAGYRLRSIQGMDMMPQTYHLEVIAVLER
jgi:23S rRNA (uracil1939-C5)-methyltransferase